MTTTMKSGSNLERVLASGQPAVTGELGPPMSADPAEVVHKAHVLKGFCDAANITDCQTAVVRISSIAAAVDRAARGPRAGDADDLPRPQPDRDAGRPARRRGARRQELPLHRRRPPVLQRGRQAQGAPGREERLRRRHDAAGRHPEEDARRGAAAGRRQAAGRAEVLHRRLLDADGRPDGLPAGQPEEEGRRRRGLHPDAGDLRRRALPLADEEGRATSGASSAPRCSPGSSSRRAR